MPRYPVFALALSLVLILPIGLAPRARGQSAAEDRNTFFELKVRPVLAGTCVKCHGPDKAGGGLRLDSRAAALEGGDRGPAVMPGDPEQSLIVQAIRRRDEELKMPPSAPLPESAVADLTAWIASGAEWPAAPEKPAVTTDAKHWAFEPLRGVEIPADLSGWSNGPLDRLIASERHKHKTQPVGPADRQALIRRASFDLIGLPPSPERVAAFVADDRPDAFARLVEELLDSPQYGERWGRYWLDLARYADTAGDNSDYPIREAYLYRDYVIDAFNSDVPYDRFLHEQLAGDILAREGPPEDYARRVIATGFIAQSKRFGTRKLEDIHQIIEDTLNTTGQVILGLSLRCARCHDHKFDPISSKDYYALYGFFAGTKYPFAGAEEDHRPSEFASLVPPDRFKEYEAKYARRLAGLKANLADAEANGEASRNVRDLGLALAQAEFLANADGPERWAKPLERAKVELAKATRTRDIQLRRLRDEIKSVEEAGPIVEAPKAYAVRDGDPTEVRLQVGGDPRKLGDVVPRGVLHALENDGTIALPAAGSGRLELARWLTEGAARHLTARVMVNRVWQHHFGKPIVATPSDFGLRGAPPTHPELLDWLASEFIASGWSIKAMHLRIMLSNTYQLACEDDAANSAADSGNDWYWRFDRRALDAESLRDTLLMLGGNLDSTRPGAHPFPPVSQWRYTAHHQYKAVYESSHRTVYLMVQRLHPHPYLALFNGPDTSLSTPVRDSASVPLQALFLLNSPFVHAEAKRFADALIAQEPNPSERLRLAFMKTFARAPAEAEQSRAAAFVADYARSLERDGVAAEVREHESWSALVRTLLASNEFLFVD